VPAGQRRAFFSPKATALGVLNITQLVKPDSLVVEKICAPPRGLEMGQDRSADLFQLVKMSGLSKIEAEDLLDLLEAAGYDLCQLSFIDGEGFSVRPTSLPAEQSPPARQPR
jgi:hypothetical protein